MATSQINAVLALLENQRLIIEQMQVTIQSLQANDQMIRKLAALREAA